MTTGTLLFVHLIPRIPRGELKSIFFFTNIFWTHETDFANCFSRVQFFPKRRCVHWAFRDKDNVSVKQKSLWHYSPLASINMFGKVLP